MTEKDELDVSLGGEMTSRHLLALVLELRDIRESEANRKLQVGLEKIRQWRLELQKEGLIESDDYLSDPPMRITKAGFKNLKVVENTWIAQEADSSPQSDVKGSTDSVPLMKRLPRLDAAGIRSLGMDVLIVSSTLFSLYLLKLFFENPNMEVMSFLFGIFILAAVLVFYQQYKKDLRAREFIGFFKWLIEEAKKNQRYILALIVVVLIVYSVGMIILTKRNVGIYLLFSVVVASSILIIFAPKKTTSAVLRFYIGVILLVGGLMLIAGLLSLTEYVANEKIVWVDMIFGLGILFVAHMNEKALGLASISRKH